MADATAVEGIKTFGNFLYVHFMQTGLGWAMIGAMLSVMLGCAGSARGIRIAAAQGAGVLSEKPDLFGKLLVLMVLPGTQGFYGFVLALLFAFFGGLIGGGDVALVKISPVVGLSMLAIGVCAGYVFLKSAIFQGETSAASINLVAKKPDQSGRAILFPTLVETYAVVALLAGILLAFFLTKDIQFTSPELAVKAAEAAAGIN